MKLEAGTGPPIDDPTAQDIADGLADLDDERGGFVVLSRDKQTYLQASGTPSDGFVLEYRDGGPDAHFRSRAADRSLSKTQQAFQAYADGRESWDDGIEWESVEVKRTPSEGVGCLSGLTAFVLATGTVAAVLWM
jgi:hypothetical protein